MDEYIARKAVLTHLQECKGTPPELCYTFPLYVALECFVKMLPVADAVEVTRCQNCQYSRELDRKSAFENRFPEDHVFCMEFIEPMQRDGYCYRAKRKDGAK